MAERFRAYNASGKVVAEGEMSGDSVSFDAGPDEVVDTVVFYSGEPGEEAVVGSSKISSSGPITATLAG